MEPPTVWLKVECPRASTSQPAFPLAPNTYRRGLRRAWYRTRARSVPGVSRSERPFGA